MVTMLWWRRVSSLTSILMVCFLWMNTCTAVGSAYFDQLKLLANHSYSLPFLRAEALVPILDKQDIVRGQADNLYIIIKTEDSMASLATSLDSALTQRPWWLLLEIWSSDAQQNILLQRVRSDVEKDLKAIVARNYHPQDVCRAQPMHVFNGQADTWGNKLVNLKSYIGQYPKAIFGAFATRTGDVKDTFFFTNGSDCSEINKYNCLFLPSTNCSYPKEAYKKCPVECHPTLLFKNASEDGQIYSNVVHRDLAMGFGGLKIQSIRMESQSPELGILSGTTTTTSPEQHRNVYEFHPYAWLFRYKTDFQQMVQMRKHAFYESTSPSFLPTNRCVAIHIRRNDRTLKAVKSGEMDAWCQKRSIVDDYGNIQVDPKSLDENGNKMGIGKFCDMGCGMRLPYGDATLEHYLNASHVLSPDINNVFIMTDDAIPLQKEIEQYNNNIALKSHLNNKNIHLMAASADHRKPSLSSAADFWAAVNIAQQCQSIVGYIAASAASTFIYEAMCYHHGVGSHSKFYTCPPVYGLRTQKVKNPAKKMGGNKI